MYLPETNPMHLNLLYIYLNSILIKEKSLKWSKPQNSRIDWKMVLIQRDGNYDSLERDRETMEEGQILILKPGVRVAFTDTCRWLFECLPSIIDAWHIKQFSCWRRLIIGKAAPQVKFESSNQSVISSINKSWLPLPFKSNIFPLLLTLSGLRKKVQVWREVRPDMESVIHQRKEITYRTSNLPPSLHLNITYLYRRVNEWALSYLSSNTDTQIIQTVSPILLLRNKKALQVLLTMNCPLETRHTPSPLS